jgi:flagellar FliL protein
MPDPEILEDASESSPKTAKTKGPALNIVLMVVGGVTVLLALGFSFMMVNTLMKSQQPQAEAQSQAAGGSAVKSSKDDAPKEELGTLYKFEKAIIVNLAETNAERYLKVDVVFELDSPKLTKEIDARLPQLLDLLINILSNKTLDDISTTSGRNLLRQEMIDKINAILMEGRLKNIYFTEFVVQ